MGNILNSLGHQRENTGHREVIQAIEGHKANINNLVNNLNKIISDSEERAAQARSAQNQNNANIRQTYAEQSYMNQLQKLDNAQKDAQGKILPTEMARIQKELENERQQFFTENGYSTTQHKSLGDSFADGVKGLALKGSEWFKEAFSKDKKAQKELPQSEALANATQVPTQRE